MKYVQNYSYTADAFRIVAIIAVITIHVSGAFVNYPPYFHGVSWWFANLIDASSRAAVPLFIMLSGALLLDSRKAETHTQYFKKRIKRVGIPLIVWSILYLLWQHFFWAKQLSLLQISTDFISPYIYYHLYFLYVILGLYILVPFLRIFVGHMTKRYLRYTLVCGFIFVGVLYALNALLQEVRVSFNGLTLFIPYIPYFLAGHYFWQKRITRKMFVVYAVAFTVLAVLTSILNFYNMQAIGWTNHFSQSMNFDRYFYEHFSPNVIGMSFLAFVLLRNISSLFPAVKKSTNHTVITFTASVVFGMYLIHPMIIDVIERYYPVFTLVHIDEKAVWVMLPVKILVVTLVSYGIVFLGRKIKLLRTIFG